MDLYCSTLDRWDGPRRGWRDQARSNYGANWSTIVADLGREATNLGADELLILLDVQRSDLRLDSSGPKAAVKVPPAAAVVMPKTKHGPLRWQCDRWDDWRHNVRAIGLTLQRLRLIDELGVATGGQQYTGWLALGAGPGQLADPVAQAWEVLRRQADPGTDPLDARALYRSAAKNTHPDGNGTDEAFAEVEAAFRSVGGA